MRSNSLQGIEALLVAPGCSTAFIEGLNSFKEELTASHSLTSRRYSIWSLVHKHLDQPFLAALEGYTGAWERRLVGGCLLSEMGCRRPAWRVKYSVVQSPGEAFDEARFELLSTKQRGGRPKGVLLADWQLANLRKWDSNLRFAIRMAQDASDDPFGVECLHFTGTLDTVRLLLVWLSYCRPARSVHPDYDGRLADAKARRHSTSYCELCWRQTLRSSAFACLRTERFAGESDSEWEARLDLELMAKRLPTASWRRWSNRFCRQHDPRDPGSRYRADLPYKEAFRHEVEALMGRRRSNYVLRFPLPRGADQQEVRKAAYDLVHSRLRPLGATEPGVREKVVLMAREGLSQAEMVRRLGVSRQTVSKAMKSFSRLMSVRSSEAYIDPTSGEVSISDEQLALIHAMELQGATVADIARAAGLFPHTVKAFKSGSIERRK